LGFDFTKAFESQVPQRVDARRAKNDESQGRSERPVPARRDESRGNPPREAREHAPRREHREPREPRESREPARDDRSRDRETRREEPARETDARETREAPETRAPRESRDDRGGRRGGRGERGRGRGGRSREGAREGAPRERERERAPARETDADHERDRSDFSAAPVRDDVEPEGGWGGAFAQFPISKLLLRALSEIGFTAPTEIQTRVIPIALSGRDVVGQARTGTGKTAAFAIPILEKLLARAGAAPKGDGRMPKALILAPTRELALQVEGEFVKIGKYTQCRSVPVYGGASMEPQLRALRNGADVIVGTPGRVMDHVRRGTLKLDQIEFFVLDEADRMFDLGFRDDIYWVARRLPENGRQTMLLSATMPDEVLKLAKQVTAEPELVYTASPLDTLTVDTVSQGYVAVDHERKTDCLLALVAKEDPAKGIVFTRTKRGADRVALKLRDKGFDAEEIHGDLRQSRREQILARFRKGDLHLLIATDVAARGLDIDGVTHIFNYDIPENPEDYVHRIGRTARMGKDGRAITFVTREDGLSLTEIEKLINKHIPREEIEGFRWESTAEERGDATASHPLAEKLSPALLSLLNSAAKKGRGGPRGGGGGGRGGPRGGPGGGRGGPRGSSGGSSGGRGGRSSGGGRGGPRR
jgi:superfamily II DNA/RNA helicase